MMWKFVDELYNYATLTPMEEMNLYYHRGTIIHHNHTTSQAHQL